ncbi:MAG TPA: hypothetical protein VK502_00375 [Candidatus Saccharimonadales bacterium]|nr:hypothetical protein [Candidatus Saccharimonadales bacterium]
MYRGGPDSDATSSGEEFGHLDLEKGVSIYVPYPEREWPQPVYLVPGPLWVHVLPVGDGMFYVGDAQAYISKKIN